MLQLRIGGLPARAIAPHSRLKYSHTVNGGPLAASWTMPLPRGFTHPLLRRGTLVEILLGTWRIWVGTLTEPDRAGWTFSADGLFRRAERLLALDSAGAPTTNPDTAVYQATLTSTGRPVPLPWVYPATGGPFPTTSTSTSLEAAAQPVYIANLLGDRAQKDAKVWGIDPVTMAPYYRTVPTTANTGIVPGTPALPVSDDDYATRLVGRRVATVAGTPPTPATYAPSTSNSAAADASARRWGGAEEWVDLTDRGLLSGPDAVTILNLMVDTQLSKPSYTADLPNLGRGQIINLGGAPIDPRLVCAGQVGGDMRMIRQHGVLDTEGVLVPGQAVEWVLGASEYDEETGTLKLSPLGKAARTLPEVIQVATASGPAYELQGTPR
ncbi:hypothetical protein [Nocardioides fonticola]